MSNISNQASRVPPHPLALDWWAVGLRGLLAILIGLVALFLPGAAIGGLVLLFAAYLLIDGALAIVGAVRAVSRHGHWALLLVEGVADLAAAAIALMWPLMTVVILIYLMAGWAVASGIFLLVATFRHPSNQGQWWMRVGALVSILWGVLLLFAPLLGALVITWWIAGYALFFGGALLALAWRLHRVHAHHRDTLPRTV